MNRFVGLVMADGAAALLTTTPLLTALQGGIAPPYLPLSQKPQDGSQAPIPVPQTPFGRFGGCHAAGERWNPPACGDETMVGVGASYLGMF